MKNNDLALNVHFMPANKASLVFKKVGSSFRINRLNNALSFLGSMKQLLQAIEWGGKQNCRYPLHDDTGKVHSLRCRFSGEEVKIDVGRLPDLKPVFHWQGSVPEFRSAVTGIQERSAQFALLP